MQTNIEALGVARQNAHPQGTQRYYDNPNTEDIIGMAGELVFANRYGLIPDTSIKPQGDDHVDFEIIWNNQHITFDVKTATKAYNLLVKEWEIDVCADVLILADYNNGDPILLGWEDKWEMKKQPTKVFSSLGINNYYLHNTKLKPMSRIDDFFTAHKDEIVQVDRNLKL